MKTLAPALALAACLLVTGAFAQPPRAPVRAQVKWNNPGGSRIPGVTHHSFWSTAVNAQVGYNVYLPPGYAESGQRYPVIYFLHGAGGDENSDAAAFSALVARQAERGATPAICVFPNGGTSGYRDNENTGVMGETLIMKELIPLIDRNYHTQRPAAGRVIAGFSLGGSGALRLALKHTNRFSAAASWAASFRKQDPEFTPLQLGLEKGAVRLLMIVGDRDVTQADHKSLLAALKDAHYPHDYRELPGVGHDLGLYHRKTGPAVAAFLLKRTRLIELRDPLRDQEVLETVLLDLKRFIRLERPNDKGRMHYTPGSPGGLDLADLRPEQPLNGALVLPTTALSGATEAIEDTRHRARDGYVFAPFQPRSNDIVLADLDEIARRKLGRQIFALSTPGFSKDGKIAVAGISFSHSGGFHGASAAYALRLHDGAWDVIARNILLFV